MKLNNIEQITKLDKNELAKSISLIPAQIKQILEDTREIKIPAEYKNIDQIVISGMGGSNLGPKIIKSVYSNEIKVPFSINADYQIPASVNKNTLFILSSYSGNTEEVLHTYKEAKKRKAKIMIVTAGGKLAEIIKKDNLPGYVFEDINNPSGQPRIGIGYSIACLLVLLSKAGVLKINKEENTTIFLTSHDVGDIESLCDRTMVINHGVLIKDLPTEDLAKTFVFEKYIDLVAKDNFGNFPELPTGIMYLEKDKNKVTVAVDINKINVQDSLRKLLDLFLVEDIDVYNADLETVIRHIYERDSTGE